MAEKRYEACACENGYIHYGKDCIMVCDYCDGEGRTEVKKNKTKKKDEK